MASAALVVIIVSLASVGGYHIVRALAHEQRFFVALTAGTMLGITLWTGGLNGMARILPLRLAGWLTLTLLLGLAGYVSQRWPRPPLQVQFDRPILAAGTFAVVLAGFYGVIFAGNPKIFFDAQVHQPIIATMVTGSFPPRWPGAPSLPLDYHYGADLFAAGLSAVSGIPPWQAELVVILILLSVTWLFVQALAVHLTGQPWIGWTAGLAVFLGGTWINQISATRMYDVLPRTVASYGFQLLHLPTAMATPLSFLALYLGGRFSRTERPYALSVLMGVVLGIAGLVAEYVAALLWASLAALIGLQWLRRRRQPQAPKLGPWVLALTIAGLLFAFHGGVISGAVQHLRSGESAWAVSFRFAGPTVAAWNDRPPYYEKIPIDSVARLWFLFREFGLSFIGIAGLAWLIWRRRWRSFSWQWLMVAAAFSALLALFVQFPLGDENRQRLFVVFRDFGNFAFGALLGSAWLHTRRAQKRRWVFSVSLAVCALIFFSGAMMYLARQWETSVQGLKQNTLPPELDVAEQVAAVVGNRLPAGSIILTNRPTTVGWLWGQFTAAYDPTTHWGYQADYFANAAYLQQLRNPSPEQLRALGITHIYVTPPSSRGGISPEPMATALYEHDPRFELLYQSHDADGERRIYAFHP